MTTDQRIKLVELYAGSCTLSTLAERDFDMDTLSTDSKQYGKVKLVGDIMDRKILRQIVKARPDIIWASSPCTGFSIASVSHHFRKIDGEFVPWSSTAAMSIMLALRVFEILQAIKKEHGYVPVFAMENPRGMMRHMKFMKRAPIRHTVSYCQYGHTSMKPTDLWTNLKTWQPRPMCKRGDSCHESAPRGSKSGTQGLENAHERAKLPKQLCREFLRAAKARVIKKRKQQH